MAHSFFKIVGVVTVELSFPRRRFFPLLYEAPTVSDVVAPSAGSIAPLPYHREVVSYLKSMEPELWRWASSAEVRSEFAEETRTALLKANYRLDADGHPELAERCAAVSQ